MACFASSHTPPFKNIFVLESGIQISDDLLCPSKWINACLSSIRMMVPVKQSSSTGWSLRNNIPSSSTSDVDTVSCIDALVDDVTGTRQRIFVFTSNRLRPTGLAKYQGFTSVFLDCFDPFFMDGFVFRNWDGSVTSIQNSFLRSCSDNGISVFVLRWRFFGAYEITSIISSSVSMISDFDSVVIPSFRS